MIKTINDVGIQSNDIKVLGKVVSISNENDHNGLLAEALQIWDSGFNYFDYKGTNGTNQNIINDIIGSKVADLDAAGLIPNGGVITIKNPVNFTKNITLADGITVGPNLHVTGNIVADHTITGNDIVSNLSISGVTLNISGQSTLNTLETTGNATVDGNLLVRGELKVANTGSAVFDGPVTINNFGNSKKATATEYGVVRLTNGNSLDNLRSGDDVVPVSQLKYWIQYLLDNNDSTKIDSIRELLDYVDAQGTNIPTTIGKLNDVTTTAPKAGDVLYYDGTKWVNKPFADLINDYLNQINNNIANANLWQVSNGYLVPKTSNQNVATTGTGKFYSGI